MNEEAHPAGEESHKVPKQDMSMTCKLDLRQLTKSLQGFNNTGEGLPILDDTTRIQSRAIIDVFADEVRALRTKETKISGLVQSLLEKLHIPDTHYHLIIGGKAIAEKVEETTTDQPSYHNQHHIAEVVAACYILGKRERLPNLRVAELVVAAAAHDLGHTGGNNSKPFELETLSCNIAIPLLREAGWNEQELFRFWQMIVGTDFMNAVPGIREAYIRNKPLEPDNEDRLLSTQCLLLTEADILFSCFSSEYNEELSRLLSQEWGLTTENLTVQQRINFLNMVQFISEAAQQLGLEDRRKSLIADLEKDLPPS